MRLDLLDDRASWTRRTWDDDRTAQAARSAASGATVKRPDHAETVPWRVLLDRYLAGWAEANPIKIIQATAPGYRLDDPFVGLFTRWSVPQYFELLQAQLAAAGAIMQADLGFLLRGPMQASSSRLGLQFCREAPRIGLTGTAEIKVGERGVIAETVAYDLNLASHVLRRTSGARIG